MRDSGEGQGILLKEASKMQKGLEKIALVLVAVGLSMALLLTGAIPICEAAPEGKKFVKIGNHVCLTGPGASTTLYLHYGQFDYVSEFNQRGGFGNDIFLDMMWYDDGPRVAEIIRAQRRFQEAGH